MIDAARDALDNFWVLMPVKVLAVLVIFLTFPLVVGYMEHKVMAHMQARVGPMEAGRFHGVLQLVADGIKFVQKEAIFPKAADRMVFALAPAVALIPNARQAASCCACTMASSACLEMSVALTIMASAARPSGAAAPNA